MSTFTSPLGPIQFSHPSQSPSFLPLPSSSRLRAFFRPSSSSSSSKPNHGKKDKKTLPIEVEWIETEKDTYTPLEGNDRNDSSPPPPYCQSTEEDLYCEDVEVKMSEKERKKQERLERKRRELMEADQRISEALKGFGI